MGNTPSPQDGTTPRPVKRARVALACQRCKTRKQKCDGKTPQCSNCKSFNAVCKYIKPARLTAGRQDRYIKATEERLAELENLLAQKGIQDEGWARWRQLKELMTSDSGAAQNEHASRDKHDDQSGTAANDTASKSPEAHSASAPEERERELPTPRPAKRTCIDASLSDHNVSDTESEARHSKQQEIGPVVDILRDLSLEASGGYIGASSSITMSRMVSSLVKTRNEPALESPKSVMEVHLSPRSMSDTTYAEEGIWELGAVPQEIADRLLRGYLKHISTRWPILHSTYIRSLHHRRNMLVGWEAAFLHLIYASGGRFLETTGETGAFFSNRHHSAAMQYLDELLQYHDIRSVQLLILLAIYSLRAPKGPGAWTYIGLAMRTCIDLGLHRRTPHKRYSILESEMRKRIFWTAYCLDRQISIILGRPFAISDRDIDVELPLDVDESVQDTATFESAQAAFNTNPGQTPAYSTSLSCFIHICRLRRIESQIQQTVYRVDESSPATEQEIESFIQQLDDWKEKIPADARSHSGDKPTTTTDTMVIDGYGYYVSLRWPVTAKALLIWS
jgi:hypothetical protein